MDRSVTLSSRMGKMKKHPPAMGRVLWAGHNRGLKRLEVSDNVRLVPIVQVQALNAL